MIKLNARGPSLKYCHPTGSTPICPHNSSNTWLRAEYYLYSVFHCTGPVFCLLFRMRRSRCGLVVGRLGDLVVGRLGDLVVGDLRTPSPFWLSSSSSSSSSSALSSNATLLASMKSSSSSDVVGSSCWPKPLCRFRLPMATRGTFSFSSSLVKCPNPAGHQVGARSLVK